MKQIKRNWFMLALTVVTLSLLAMVISFGQLPQKPEALLLTETEKLKLENLSTKLQNVRLQKMALQDRFRVLSEQEKHLDEQLTALAREVAKGHGHPEGSIDLDLGRVVPKQEAAKKEKEKQP